MNCARCKTDMGNTPRACQFCGAVVSTPDHRFVASAPLRTHWDKVTCREVDCQNYLMGFTVSIDVSDGARIGRFTGQDMADWMRNNPALKFTEQRVGDVLMMKFEPGHECLDGIRGMHKRPRGASVIEPEMVHASRTGLYRHERREDWREDMQETNLRIARGR